MSLVLPLVEQLSNLAQLQEIDFHRDQLKKQSGVLPKELEEIQNSWAALRQLSQQKQAQIVEQNKAVRQIQAAIDLNLERTTRIQAKLEQVTTTPEYQAVHKEMEQVRKLHLSLEEQFKQGEALSAQYREELALIETQTQTQADTLAARQNDVEARLAALQTELEELNHRSQGCTAGVDSTLLRRYEKIRPARAGLGLAKAEGGRCMACHMFVPPQLYNEIQRRAAIHQCPCCNRLLYAPLPPSQPLVSG